MSVLQGTTPTKQELLAIAQHNASSPLLSLPQEIKNKIYGLISGNYRAYIHGQHLGRRGSNEGCCEGDPSKRKDCWSRCPLHHTKAGQWVTYIQFIRPPFNTEDLSAGPCIKVKQSSFGVQYLRTCRQVFNEAKYMTYSCNQFSLTSTVIFNEFGKYLVQSRHDYHLAMRSLHLAISVTPAYEKAWQLCLVRALRHFKNVQQIEIVIFGDTELFTHGCRTPIEWETTAKRHSRTKLIAALLRLAELPLNHVSFRFEWDELDYLTDVQKEEWEGYIERKLLASADSDFDQL